MQVSQAERSVFGDGEAADGEDLLRRQVHRWSVDKALEAQELGAYRSERQAKQGQREDRQKDQSTLHYPSASSFRLLSLLPVR